MRLDRKAWVVARVSVCVIAGLRLSAADALPSSHPVDSRAALGSELGDSVKEETTSKKRSIRYCPDNTCDEFVALSSVTSQQLADFAYLYLFFFSDYLALKEWREGERAKETADLILNERFQNLCPKNVGVTKARCVLKRILRKNEVRVYAIRYDENAVARRRVGLP
jgi:hypothetical protein